MNKEEFEQLMFQLLEELQAFIDKRLKEVEANIIDVLGEK